MVLDVGLAVARLIGDAVVWFGLPMRLEFAIEDREDVDMRRLERYNSRFGLAWMVIADVALEQQWHKLKTFIVVVGNEGEVPLIGSINEHRRQSNDGEYGE